MPNVVVGAITVAITVAIIDRAVSREAQRRIQPRVDDVLGRIGLGLHTLVFGLVIDYAGSHLDTFKPIPAEASAVVDQWLADQDAVDWPQPLAPDGDEPLVIQHATMFLDSLEVVRERDREVIEPDLVHAIEAYGAAVRRSRMLLRRPSLRDRNEEAAVRSVVEAAGRFTAVFARHAPQGCAVHPQLREAARSHNEQMCRMRDHTAYSDLMSRPEE